MIYPEMKKNWLILLIMTALWLGLRPGPTEAGPAVLARKNIELSLKETRIGELSASGLTLSFYLLLENNSSRNYGLVSYQYQVLINDREYFRQPVSLDQPIGLPAGRQALVNFPVRINYQYLEPYLTGSGRQASCRMSGEIIFQDEKKKKFLIYGFGFGLYFQPSSLDISYLSQCLDIIRQRAEILF